jgi:hypothetical protein
MGGIVLQINDTGHPAQHPHSAGDGCTVWVGRTTPGSDSQCHTRFSVENRMHLICVPGSQFHTYDRLMSVISQDIAQNVQKRFINFYYTHDGRHEGLYTNNDNYEDATPSSSSTGF